ncbi:MAG: glycerophosphodiester phosphodiesterase [Cyclobacteriaceae bacterium]|nr:glycerophosphodiester phosphodiesterase [Cyclobacteriaceae bacterium]
MAAVAQTFDLQGHRGCRGLMPENSIPGFLKAMELGVNTLEMDVVISADGKVVVSHDPYISADFCLNEIGRQITKNEEKKLLIYQMLYDDVKQFDCGSKGHKAFPEQARMTVYKPLLSEVITTCEAFGQSRNLAPVHYNIELKSSPAGDMTLHPEPAYFVELVYNVIKCAVPAERICIQSFDMRILQTWKLKYPDYTLSYLVENSKSASKNLEELGFTPTIYSPHYKLLNQKCIEELHAKSIKVIPWTVNKVEDMRQLKTWGVDGLITDFPDLYMTNFSLTGE